MKNKKNIAILGGGPSGLFIFKRLIDTGRADLSIDIFEKKKHLGAGMPYSTDGANKEHITNVSGNEIPQLVTSVEEWIATAPESLLQEYNITPKSYNDYKVLPRLLFGCYLSAQFELLQQQAVKAGILHNIYYSSHVTDITDQPETQCVIVETAAGKRFEYDEVILCTGHTWPTKYEGTIPGYFDSPYPPAKLAFKADHPVAIKGSSLTAIDAIRTLGRNNGAYAENGEGRLTYLLNHESGGFKMVMHSRNGLLPAVRFHLEDSHLVNDAILTRDEIDEHIAKNKGFLSLDFIFEKNFKIIFKDQHPDFYILIKDLNMEEFVEMMMNMRESLDPFELLRLEYAEAERSIERRESIYWKEMLGVLSFAMNYPAKYLSAEDMQRLQKVLMPLISIVIAYVPQSSCLELLALHEAGVLDIIPVGDDSRVTPEEAGGATYHYTGDNGDQQFVYYKTFVDCVGQPHLAFEDFPFKSLIEKQTISPARLKFRYAEEGKKAMDAGNENVEQDSSGEYLLKVPGININDYFQVIGYDGEVNPRMYVMAVPYIGGYNPDYSGLDFCEEASGNIIKGMFKTEPVL